MPTPPAVLDISFIDPLEPEAVLLTDALTREVTIMYDHQIDGAGHFKPEDVRVPRSGFIIGRVDDRAVACGAFRPLEPGIAEIKRMFVHPDFRGHGYSKAILLKLEQLARDHGYSAARLETRYRQASAIALYEKMGYRRIPNYGIYVGAETECFCYEKSLTAG